MALTNTGRDLIAQALFQPAGAKQISPTDLTYAAGSITTAGGIDWTDYFEAGDWFVVGGSTSNNKLFRVSSLTATVITLDTTRGDDAVAEGAGSGVGDFRLASFGIDGETDEAYVGVGDSTTAFAAAQTNLQAASNKFRQGMETGYPTKASNVLTFRSLVGTADANFAWEEWGVFNHATDAKGVMLNRLVENLGTKTNAQTWQITVTLTVNAG